MAQKTLQFPSGDRIPETRRVVRAACQDKTPIRGKGNGPYPARMPGKTLHLLSCSCIPELCNLPATGQDKTTVRRIGSASHIQYSAADISHSFARSQIPKIN